MQEYYLSELVKRTNDFPNQLITLRQCLSFMDNLAKK